MLFSKAIEGFLLEAYAGRYSPSHIPTIKIQLDYMCKWLGDPDLDSVTSDHWKKYMVHLRTDYKPRRFSGNTAPLALSTVDNHWKVIRGFYNWATENNILSIDRPDLKLERQKFDSPQIIPFTKEEVERLITACEYTQVIKQSGKTYRIKRPNWERDKAMLMILLDTGLRLGEFLRVCVGDINLENGEIYIRPHRDGRKSKSRTVYIGARTRQVIWKYIAKQQAESDQSLPLFNNIKATGVRQIITRIAHNAKVANAHPHKFRHTMAIMYLRNGGDVFTLQRILGHATLEMTMKYVHIVKSDISNAHRIASPVDNWKL